MWCSSGGEVLDNVEMVTALLEAGAEVDALSSKGETALQAAVRKNMLSVVGKLLEHGASLNVKGSESCLYYAVKNNNLEMLQFLMDHGADPTSSNGVSALAEAFGHCNQEMIDVLLKSGASLTPGSLRDLFDWRTGENFVRSMKMMLENKNFEIPEFSVAGVGAKDYLLARAALAVENCEQFQELAQSLREKGATVQEACRRIRGYRWLVRRGRMAPNNPTLRDLHNAQERLEGLLGGLTKGAM